MCFSSDADVVALCPCRYNISWAVDSHAPVEEFKLFFRRLPKEAATAQRGTSPKYGERLQSLQHQSQQYQGSIGVSDVDGGICRVSGVCQHGINWRDNGPHHHPPQCPRSP